MLDKIIALLKEKHGKDLDLRKDVYYLFMKGGMFSIYYDEDEKTIKVNVEMLPEENTFVYMSDENIEDLLG